MFLSKCLEKDQIKGQYRLHSLKSPKGKKELNPFKLNLRTKKDTSVENDIIKRHFRKKLRRPNKNTKYCFLSRTRRLLHKILSEVCRAPSKIKFDKEK